MSHLLNVLRAYCDGGCITPNPSEIGGTWACIWVGFGDVQISQASGVILPDWLGLPAVTNNVSELVAAVECLEQLPDEWGGLLYTDSHVTRCRLVNADPAWNGIPEWLIERTLKARQRLTRREQVVLLDGHPTRAQLASGRGKRGNPVSPWNVACDAECKRLAILHRMKAPEVI